MHVASGSVNFCRTITDVEDWAMCSWQKTTFVSAGRVKHLNPTDQLVLTWWVVTGIIHFIVEGSHRFSCYDKQKFRINLCLPVTLVLTCRH